MERDSSDLDEPASTLLLVEFRGGEAVTRHPDVAPFLRQGWKVHSARPRLTEEGTRLLVVLHAPRPSITARVAPSRPADRAPLPSAGTQVVEEEEHRRGAL